MRKIAFALVGLLSAVPAFAKVMTFEYTGVISTLVDDSGSRVRNVAQSAIIPGGVAIGDAFHGTFSYETSVPLTDGVYSGSSWNPMAGTPVTTFILDKSGASIVSNTAAPSLSVTKQEDFGGFFTVSANIPYAGGAFKSLSFNFSMDDGTVITEIAPPTKLDIDAFWSSNANVGWYQDGKYLNATGLLTSVTNVSPVPEPESFAMIFAGLTLVAVGARRKRSRDAAQ